MAPRNAGRLPNRELDARNPLYREAEDRVLRWFLARGDTVDDNRPLNVYHDFTLNNARTLDVKADTQAHRTGRVAWESVHIMADIEGAGAVRPGWGQDTRLVLVCYVLVPPEGARGGTWPAILVGATPLREAIAAAVSQGEEGEGRPLKAFIAPGSDRTASGYAVRVDWLEEHGLVLVRMEV